MSDENPHSTNTTGAIRMDTPLPSNDELVAFGKAIHWTEIERQKRIFNQILKDHAATATDDSLPLDAIAAAIGTPVTAHFGMDDPKSANVILTHHGDRSYILGCVVSARYRSGKTLSQSIVPFNFNPSVNHTNIAETDDPGVTIRAIGAELELGLIHPDGTPPTIAQSNAYIEAYQEHARRLGIMPQVDREACQYQIEVHVAPGIGYHRTRNSLDGIMAALSAAGEDTGLYTAILSSYPVESDFKLSEDAKVRTAVDLMVEVNNQFPDYAARIETAKARYHIDPSANVVEVFRLQGCHIHLDLAGRSEALGLLAFYTMLRSASAVANSAVLKGGPFVNGTCDAELLCTREYLRQTTVTGRIIERPLSPQLIEGDLERYAALLKNERANAMARGLLYDDTLGSPTSAMHSLLGRLRPDLGMSKRICTIESTGMPINVSASRQAAVLTDFEYTHAIVENYFRKHGLDLEPMYADRDLWSIVGPLSIPTFIELHHQSDRHCTDITLETATGEQMSLADFYERKRRYLHRHLTENVLISPRDIDEVYHSLQRMLEPPSGQSAQTVEQYITDYKLRSTGNWGLILRNTFMDEGGVPGTHNPQAVQRVVNRIHEAIRARYTQS
ncbi:MAG: hypothetical protein GFH27_549395n10 [Chloroflexi bacterium AL-W]|nr:hypothetical protein [Chloroflexi bacterium AL-W]